MLEDGNNFSPACELREINIEQQNEVTNDYSLISDQNTEYGK